MSVLSSWPLPKSSVRYMVPKPVVEKLKMNIVSRGLYPIAFGYYENAFGHQIERKEHTDNLLIFCVEGKARFQSEYFQTDIEQNDVLLIPKELIHKYQADKKNPWTIYWAHMEGHLFEQFMDILALNKWNLKVSLSNSDNIRNEFKELINIREQGFSLNSYILASNLLKKLMSLLTIETTSLQTLRQKHFQLETVKAYFEENITGSLTLEQMAATTSLSKFHFAKKFQQTTGISPIKYFLELKISNACYLLDSSDKSIRDIAATFGFDDPYYFSRLFKKIMGISPKQYRQSKI